MLGRGREPAAHARPTTSWSRSRARWASPTPSTRPRSASSSAARATAGGTEVADPFFGGAGPRRTTCIGCGECMSGCRHNAKNTLVKNYLYLAEQNGATVLPLTTVTRLSPRAEEHGGGWDVHVRFTKAKTGRASATRVLRAEQVVRRGLLAGHPAAAAPDARRGPPAAALAPAGLPVPHQLGVDPRRHRAGPDGRLQPGHRDHVELPPRPRHPHRARAATARAATSCRSCRPC